MKDTSPPELTLQIARIEPITEAEGPGRRFAVWLQGCPLRCPGCCNPEMLPFAGGESRRVADVAVAIDAARTEGIEGITLLGGEPMTHAAGAVALARQAHERGLSVLVFTGFTLEEVRALPDPHAAELLAETDILVDGPYRNEQPETRRRWIGSANQCIHFLSSRCDPDDPRWLQPNTLEIRLRGRELSINGFPAASAVDLWKRVPIHRSRDQ
jgi:anaerobic ribonucleoside-triphosphate reductase activating protein